MGNLGYYLSMRYYRTGNLEDLEAAIDHTETALKATPEDHPDLATQLGNLGLYLSMRYERTGNLEGLELAIASYVKSWSILTAPPLGRIQAALLAAQKLVFSPLAIPENLSRACTLLHDATHLIPLATARSLQRDDQQYILGELPGVAAFAAALSLQVEQSPLKALRLQELGRSVTNGQLLDYRTDISDLMEQHPMFAKEFDALRQELDSPFRSTEASSDTLIDKQLQILVQQDATRRRNRVAKDLDDILQQIRQEPGFQTFLRAESEEYFLSAAQEGPIVVLNATKLRTDAILLTKVQVTSIPLPELSHESVVKHLDSSRPTDDNKGRREMLEWLWEAALQPVLRELGFYPKAADPLPRIWWIGVGLMAGAPIHAAAKFTRGAINCKKTTLQYCLPSFTSTIRALQYSRSRKQYQQYTSMLVVTMPSTPGESSLSGVTKEADEIKHSLQNFSTVPEILEMPTAECVLQALESCSIAHFACHGVSSTNPADSHLLLVKGTGQVDKLCVKDIAVLKLPAARGRGADMAQGLDNLAG